MAITASTQVSCDCGCCDHEGLFDEDGQYRGFICRQDGEFRFSPLFGTYTELSCHSIWESLEDTYE